MTEKKRKKREKQKKEQERLQDKVMNSKPFKLNLQLGDSWGIQEAAREAGRKVSQIQDKNTFSEEKF